LCQSIHGTQYNQEKNFLKLEITISENGVPHTLIPIYKKKGQMNIEIHHLNYLLPFIEYRVVEFVEIIHVYLLT